MPSFTNQESVAVSLNNLSSDSVSLVDSGASLVSFDDQTGYSMLFPITTEDSVILATEDDYEIWTENDDWANDANKAINLTDMT